MMPILFTITASGKISPLLLTSTRDIPDISLIRMISALMNMVSRSVRQAYVCTRIDMKLPNTGRNTDAREQTGSVDASVNIPAPLRNMAEPYISLLRIIQDYSTYRQETVKHGKRNMMEELPWNAPTSVRKRTIN